MTRSVFLGVLSIFVIVPFALPLIAEVSEETKRISALLDQAPPSNTFEIEYRKVGLSGSTYLWHLKDSSFWVDLYPHNLYPMNKLDQSQRYRVEGVILDQDYGVVHIWARKVERIKDP